MKRNSPRWANPFEDIAGRCPKRCDSLRSIADQWWQLHHRHDQIRAGYLRRVGDHRSGVWPSSRPHKRKLNFPQSPIVREVGNTAAERPATAAEWLRLELE